MDNLKVISGGDGYEDFSSSASNDLAGENSNNAITIIFEKHIAKNRANTLKQCHNNLFEKYISKIRANTIEQCHNNLFEKHISNVQILFVLQDEKTPRITFCFGQSRSQQKFIMNMKSYSTNVQKWISSSKSRMNYFPFFSLSGDLTTNLYQKDDQDL